ncbi:MAG: T9SS type A sorting domain-containing protein, partial [Cytophagales bacterium]|nr:T9SS type A sorting domain-containing protein [Cytophagales bacterium]
IIESATGNTFNPTALSVTTCYRRKVIDECGTELYSNISTINIVDDPQVIVSSDKNNICSGASFELTATISGGTGTCRLIWQKNSKSSAAGSSFWEDMAGSANTLSVTDLENTSTENISVYYRAIYDCDLTNCNKATAEAIEVVVAPVVANVVTADKSIICEGEEVVLTSNGCLGTISWSNGSVLTQQAVSPSSTQYFVATCSVAGCSEIVKDSVEITVKPGVAAPTLTATTSEICFGQSSEITASGCTGDLLWSTSETTTSITVSPTSAVEYSVTCSLNGCTSPAAKTAITGYPELVAGSISSSSDINCAGYNPPEISSTAAASGGKGVLSTSWESSENCSAPTPTWNTISGANGNTYNPIALSVTTCYRRKVVDECGTVVYSNISTINIVDDPQVIVSSDKNNICSGESLELTAAISGGTGTCSITWQKNSKSSAAGSSFWEDMAGSANTLSVTDLENTSTENFSVYFRAIYDCDLTNCNKATSEAIEVVVAPVVANVVTVDKSIICEGEEVVLTSSGCLGTISWSNGSELAQQTVSPTSTQYFAATCSVAGCSEIVKDSVEITVKPGVAAPTLTATTSEICFGQSSEITASGCTGGLLWSTSETTTSITVSPTSVVEYSVTCSLNGCTSPAAKITVTGYPELVAGSISSSSDINCAGYNPPEISSTAAASGGKGVLSTFWESSENCSTPTPTWNTISGATGNSFNPTALSVTTCYRRKVIDECGTELYSNISTINIVDDPKVIVSSDKSSICSGESLELTAAISGGTGTCSIIWQKNTKSSAAGSSFWEDMTGSANTLSVTDLENTSTENISIYYRAIYDCDLTNCNKATAEAIEVVVLPTNEVMVNIQDTTICSGIPVLLKASSCGGNLTWSDGNTVSERIVNPEVSTNYTVSCTGTCGTFQKTVSIKVIPGLSKPVNTTPFSAIQPNTLTFSASGTNLKWYTADHPDSLIAAAPELSEKGEYTYWVSQSNSTCESPRLQIDAKIYPQLSITQEPYDQFDCEGNSVNFLVEAEGAGDLVYQWQRKRPGDTDFVNVYDEDDGIKNAQQKAIRVSGAGGKNNPHLTQFRCIVGDSVSVAYTIPKTLYANVINRTLPNLKACVGQDFDLNLSDYLEVIGSVTGYQWQVRDDAAGEWIDLQDDPTLTGTKTASLKFTNLQTWRSRKYRCRIFFNTGGFECIENTDQTLLRVGEYPERPADQTVEYCEGRPTRTLSFNAKPNNDLWFSSLEAWDTGSTRPPKPTSDKAGVYTWWYASVNNEGCVGPKASYTVTIHPAPPAPENTTPAVVELGDTLRFSAKGQYLKWFKSRTGRTFSFNSPFYVKPDYYTHYVSQVSQYGCEGPRTFIGAEIKSPFGINDGLEAVADCEGNSVRFEANQVGIPPLEYQWQRKRPEDSTFFTLENDTLDYIRISNVGSLLDPHLSLYRVVVTDSNDSSYVSDPITLYVNGILGNIDKAYYCSGQIWSPDTTNLDFRGEVEYYQLQKQIGRSWMVVDSTDSLAFTIHHLQDTLDGDYRIRAVFKAENGASCARSTDEFQFDRGLIPDSLGTKNMDICQYDYLYRGQLDSTENSYRWLFRADTVYNWLLEDSLQFTLAEDTTLWYSVVNKYGCFGAFDSLNIHVKPAPVLEIQNPVLTSCKLEAIEKPIWLSDPMNVLYFDEQLDSSLVKESVLVSDSVQISQYWIVKTDSGGCQSPAIQITFEVNDCKMEEDTVVNLTEENGENGKQLNLSEHSDVYQPNPYAEKPETFFNWRQEAVNTPQCDVFPNPVSRNESMNIQLKGVRPENIDVLDIQGRNMEYRVLFKEETNQKMAIMANLNEGVYILRVRDAKGNSCIQRIVLKN